VLHGGAPQWQKTAWHNNTGWYGTGFVELTVYWSYGYNPFRQAPAMGWARFRIDHDESFPSHYEGVSDNFNVRGCQTGC
jgi:hypothetical protein